MLILHMDMVVAKYRVLLNHVNMKNMAYIFVRYVHIVKSTVEKIHTITVLPYTLGTRNGLYL
jgi:hypothetical protein